MTQIPRPALLDDVLHSPYVERIFGLHVWPNATTGVVMSSVGAILAATGAFEMVVRGKGGHAAMPHLAIDPVACAANPCDSAANDVSDRKKELLRDYLESNRLLRAARNREFARPQPFTS